MKKTWKLLALLLVMCLVSLSMFACGGKTNGDEGGEPNGGDQGETPSGGEGNEEGGAENDNRVPIGDLIAGLE